MGEFHELARSGPAAIVTFARDQVASDFREFLAEALVTPSGIGGDMCRIAYPGIPGQAGESKFTHYALANGVDWSIKPNLYNSLKIGRAV